MVFTAPLVDIEFDIRMRTSESGVLKWVSPEVKLTLRMPNLPSSNFIVTFLL